MRTRREYNRAGYHRLALGETQPPYNLPVNQAEFDAAISGLPLSKAAFYPTIGSTNDVVAVWAKAGIGPTALAAADEQTSGRGRAGRHWLTPAGSALAFSLLLGNQGDQLEPGKIAGLGAVAVSEALESLGLQPEIKWPNDILVNRKKICGILPEAHWAGDKLQALILGIGINVARSSIPADAVFAFPASSVEEELGREVEPARLMRSVLESLLRWKPRIDERDFLAAWEYRLAFKGELVRLELPDGGAEDATVVGLNADGALRLQNDEGTRSFQMGEIQIRSVR
jgi:BirA family biotin operon repressor/biotin-[acetyl-CoA-carboxylase] ligase